MCLELDWGRFLMPNQVAVSNIVWISSSLARGWWLEVHVGEKSLVGLLQELMCRWLKAAITAMSSKVFWILVGKSLCTQCSYCGSCNITGEANVSLNCIHVGSVFQSNDINQVSTVAFWNYLLDSWWTHKRDSLWVCSQDVCNNKRKKWVISCKAVLTYCSDWYLSYRYEVPGCSLQDSFKPISKQIKRAVPTFSHALA